MTNKKYHKGGIVMNIIILFLILNFMLGLFKMTTTPFNDVICEISGSNSTTVLGNVSVPALVNNCITCKKISIPLLGDVCWSLVGTLLFLLVGGGAAALLAGTLGFPNQYIVFALVTLFLLGFFTFPVGLMSDTSLPIEAKFFVTGIFGTIYIIAVINTFKGGEI